MDKIYFINWKYTVGNIDSEKEHMGLTSWDSAPDGKIVKSDVAIAKKLSE